MKMKKLIAAALSFVMMLGINTAPAFAATSKSASTAITAEVGSGYTVTVPEKIALTSTTTGTGTYTGTIAVNIKGDVASNGNGCGNCAYDERYSRKQRCCYIYVYPQDKMVTD